ncbi:MAG TPA: RES family NAD+ phosphorylase [Solirubrobacter sp.]|nr:RES family NAD+ phosphorylase [Solirubrobacter sp.]
MQVSLEGVWYRQIPAGTEPLSRPPDPPDGRWQRSSVVGAIYFGDTPETVWAEWYRALAEAALPPAMALPRDLWQWEIDLPRVADVTQLDLPPLVPSHRQWPQFQAVGEQLHADGWPALVSPSAARPEGCVLCVFRTERTVPGATPLPPPRRFEEPPVVPTGLRT